MRYRIAVLAVFLAGVGFGMGRCGSDPIEPTAPAPVATPAEQTVTPTPITATTGNTWVSNGLRVTVIGDQWGPGTCHENGGTRTYLLENLGDEVRYSRPGAFTSDVPECATQKTPHGFPRVDSDCPLDGNGRHYVPVGGACTYAVSVTLPAGDDGVCTLQADNCFGPGGVGECAFVVGDTFRVPNSQCEKLCVEGEWRLKTPGEWGACPEVNSFEVVGGMPSVVSSSSAVTKSGCYECRESVWTNGCRDEVRPERREVECPCPGKDQGQFCVTYLSTSGAGYYATDDGQPWLSNLTLAAGKQETCWPHAADDSRLCLFWKQERIGCATASAGVSASWHGNVEFRPECAQ
jgi:hypothetical protein